MGRGQVAMAVGWTWAEAGTGTGRLAAATVDAREAKRVGSVN